MIKGITILDIKMLLLTLKIFFIYITTCYGALDVSDIHPGNNSLYSTADVILGGLGRLPCNVTTTLPGDKVSLVIWYREGRLSPIYSFDARDTKLHKGSHWADQEALGNRASFKVNVKPTALLTIEQAQSSDAGVYRCRVDFQKSPTRNHMVNLTVILPIEKLSILDEKGSHNIPHYILGPYNEGVSVNIICVATGGRPSPRVTWWRDSALLDDTTSLLPERRTQNILKLDALRRHHLHAVFTCQASNSELSPPISSSVTLDMNLRPLAVRLRGDNKPLSAGTTYQLECEVVGARPAPTVTWWKGSVPMKDSRDTTSSDGNITVSVLTFTPTIADSGKYLSCRAVQSLIPDSGLEDGWKLDIQHVPIMTLELGSSQNSSMIRESADVYFECNIKANPWIYQIRWMHNGKQLYNNVLDGTLVSNQSLVLQNVNRSRSGIYTCVAANREGDGESNAIPLDILFAPICRPGQARNLGAARNEPASIPCEVEANPTNVNFTWKFNSSDTDMTDIAQHLIVNDKTRSVAQYVPKTEADFGTLLCWGENEIGMQKEPCVFLLTPAGKPDMLTNCTINNQTTDSLFVECVEGFNGGLPQTFSVEVFTKTSKRQLVSTITQPTPHFFITGLESAYSYEVVMTAVNKKGSSEPSILIAHTLKSAQTHIAYLPAILQLTPVMGGTIGATACLLVCIALITAIVRSRSCNNRRQGKVSGNAEGGLVAVQPPTTPPVQHYEARPMPQCHLDTLENIEEKNPDIIPQGGEDEYSEEERAFEYLNRVPSRMYTLSGTTPRARPRGAVPQMMPVARYSYACDRSQQMLVMQPVVDFRFHQPPLGVAPERF